MNYYKCILWDGLCNSIGKRQSFVEPIGEPGIWFISAALDTSLVPFIWGLNKPLGLALPVWIERGVRWAGSWFRVPIRCIKLARIRAEQAKNKQQKTTPELGLGNCWSISHTWKQHQQIEGVWPSKLQQIEGVWLGKTVGTGAAVCETAWLMQM